MGNVMRNAMGYVDTSYMRQSGQSETVTQLQRTDAFSHM